MNHIAVYPGTFDPITNGHVDMIQRARRIFDRVIVAVASNAGKAPAFSMAQRLELTRGALADIDGLDVCGFDTLLVDFLRARGARVLIRGLRAVSDFEYELQLASMNRRLAPEVDTMFLTPAEQYAYISSSLVREIAFLGGDVSPFVPEAVAAALRDRKG